MINFIFLAGQALSAIGLGYGAFLSLTYRSGGGDAREKRGATMCLHHLAAA
jgi:hypothetical protein